VSDHLQFRSMAQAIDQGKSHRRMFVDNIDARRAHRPFPGYALTIGSRSQSFQ